MCLEVAYDKDGTPKEGRCKRASITIRMSKETHKKLNEYASKHELSMTEVALRSLEEYLSKRSKCCEPPFQYLLKEVISMAKARKDERGRALRKGEVQRASDKRYMYTYTDPLGRRKFIYANDLTTLREKENN